jgi:hypothetical protein
MGPEKFRRSDSWPGQELRLSRYLTDVTGLIRPWGEIAGGIRLHNRYSLVALVRVASGETVLV